MGFHFLNPVFLWGAVAAGIPVLVHLIHRRRTRTVRFAMLDFIFQSQKKKARRFRLKEWVLLAIRTAMVLALVGLGAHPIVTQAADPSGAAGAWGAAYPSHLVAIVDTSMSMQYATEAGSRFETGKRWLRRLIAPMRGTNIALLTTESAGFDAGSDLDFAPGPGQAVQALDALQAGYGEADIVGAFQRAFGLLRTVSGGAGGRKEILFLTDGTEAGWKRFSMARLRTVDPDVTVRVIRWGEKEGSPNLVVTGVRLDDQTALRDLPVTLRARVRNFGTEARTLPVEFWLGAGGADAFSPGGKREERSVRVPPGGEAEVAFKTRIAESGHLPAKIQLRSEGLTADDAFHFSLFVRDRPRVLLVDGDPRTSLLGGETFYLMNALSPQRGLGVSAFRPRWIPSTSLRPSLLAETDVLVMANVPDPSPDLLAGIADYLRAGGGLIWFLGDRISPQEYDARLRPKGLMPVRLLGVQEGPEGGDEIEEIQTGHPVLRIFEGFGAEAFAGSRIRKYVGGVETPGAQVLLRLRGGSPLLAEGTLGEGRVMVFTSTADRDWNDFSIRAAYLPFLHNLVSYLGCRACRGGEMPPSLGERVSIGTAWTFRAPVRLAGRSLRLTGPDGFERSLQIAVGKGADSDKAFAEVRIAGAPGLYRAEHEGGEVLLAAHPPLAESNLVPLPEEELRAKFGDLRLEAPWRADLPEDFNPWKEARSDFTAWLLWSLLALAAAEVVVAGRQ